MFENWNNLCKKFTIEQLTNLLRLVAPDFRPRRGFLDDHFKVDETFDKAEQIGTIEFSDSRTVIVGAVRTQDDLTARSGKLKQYNLAKSILKSGNHNAGIFAFYDSGGRFRFSLITVTYHGTRRQFSTFRRYTFFVDPELPNKTFLQQMQQADFSALAGILETFSLEAVSDEFYKEFKPCFDAISDAVQGTAEIDLKQDFALLFAIRIIFLGFVQKKGWLGNNLKFLQDFWEEYQQGSHPADTFYREWLEPLFFEALSSPPGRKVAYRHAPFSAETQILLQMAPYLNGELFKRKQGLDNQGLSIPDALVGIFFDFLFQYNFTVEENELYDEELELNPEFLGIIFERLTNMEQGAVYTPRIEVDLMCRLALVRWLKQTTGIEKTDLYRLFFREAGTGEAYDEYQRQGDFSPAEIRELIKRLEKVTICDPAAGSGAFEVGMLQVLEQTLENLYSRNNTPEDLKAKAPGPYERKENIIARSLYGVEVKRWAVWINQLRLWLTLFVDMEDERKNWYEPLLPNLTFKVRTGDSLVQRIGDKTLPLQGRANLPREIKHKINSLKQRKRDYFYNKNGDYRLIEHEKLAVFQAILDVDIDAFREQIHGLKLEQKQKQQSISGTYQKEIEMDSHKKEKIVELEAKIAELQAQKESLKNECPFVWSIEFAEIFFGDRKGFDIIIGNPPYVRQESISDPEGVLSPGAYKNALSEMTLLDFPDYFALSQSRPDKFKKGYKPSGRSDLYTYFYIRSLRLLNSQGVHVFICSNSWLDVGYGTWLQEFFLRRAMLHLVVDNHARRSFARADINTVITVASLPEKAKGDHKVRFVAFKQPFEDVILSDNLLSIENATTTLRDERFRVFPITVGELLREGSETSKDLPRLNDFGITEINSSQLGKYVGDKWGGKYLRAPDIFFTILEKGKDKLVRLGDIAEVRFGIKTGANDFFYLEPLGPGSRPDLLRVRNGAGWEGEIEKEFLKPVIKSPRECRNIVVNQEGLNHRIFMCHKNKIELHGTKTLEYIEWGEKQRYFDRPSCRTRSPWWNLGDQKNPVAVWFKAFNDTFLVPLLLNKSMYISDRFYVIYPFSKGNWTIALNNSFVALSTELHGRANLGEGALDNMTYEAALNYVVNPRLLKRIQIQSREIQNIFIECGIDPESKIPIAKQEPKPLADRKALDDVVFDVLGLTEEERKEVYRAVCQLVWERISKARSVRRNG